jgi:hypothetical protein
MGYFIAQFYGLVQDSHYLERRINQSAGPGGFIPGHIGKDIHLY